MLSHKIILFSIVVHSILVDPLLFGAEKKTEHVSQTPRPKTRLLASRNIASIQKNRLNPAPRNRMTFRDDTSECRDTDKELSGYPIYIHSPRLELNPSVVIMDNGQALPAPLRIFHQCDTDLKNASTFWIKAGPEWYYLGGKQILSKALLRIPSSDVLDTQLQAGMRLRLHTQEDGGLTLNEENPAYQPVLPPTLAPSRSSSQENTDLVQQHNELRLTASRPEAMTRTLSDENRALVQQYIRKKRNTLKFPVDC